MKYKSFLYLSEKDVIEAGALNIEKCVSVIDQMFQVVGEGDFIMGGPNGTEHGMKVWFPKQTKHVNMPTSGPDRRFMSMISYLGGNFNVCGDKWYGSNIKNKEKGLPRSILTITLNDVNTGMPLSFISGNLISSTRTGSVPGVAAKYLANESSEVLTVVGAGVINWSCTRSILSTSKNIKKVKVYDLFKNSAETFCEKIENEFNIVTSVEKTLKDAIEHSDIITLATSGGEPPKIEEKWIKKGCFIAVTSGTNFSDEFLMNTKVFLDLWDMHKCTGDDWAEWEFLQSGEKELHSNTYYGIAGQVYRLYKQKRIQSEQLNNLGDVVSQNIPGRESNDETIVFYSGGMPIEDIAWAYTVYKNARKLNIGTWLNLWDTPYLK